jgi:hypothetical protein
MGAGAGRAARLILGGGWVGSWSLNRPSWVRWVRAEDRSVAYIAERILRAHVEDKAAEPEAVGKGRAGKPK